jgi:hypothetical protein
MVAPEAEGGSHGDQRPDGDCEVDAVTAGPAPGQEGHAVAHDDRGCRQRHGRVAAVEGVGGVAAQEGHREGRGEDKRERGNHRRFLT